MAVCLAGALARNPVRGWRTLRILRSYRRAQEWLRSNRDTPLSSDSQVEAAARFTGMPVAEVRDTVGYWMEALPLILIGLCARRDLIRAIGRWHALGVPMGAYSDYPAADKLDRLRVSAMLSCALCSTDKEIGVFKPDSRGFEIAASRLGLPPSRIVYVGDREEVDGVGARQAGMRALIVGRRSPAREGAMTIARLDTELKDAYSNH